MLVSLTLGGKMATITAYDSFNLNNLNLNYLITNQTDFYFENNVYGVFNGVAYEDVLEIEYYYYGYSYMVFGGHGVTWAADYSFPTGGTVTGFLEGYYIGSTFHYAYTVEDISVSAIQIFSAASTSSRADDFALIARALSGSDSITMSSGSDYMRGYGGSDVLRGLGGNDSLIGDGGDDVVLGGSGADTLVGNSGNDRLLGQAGNDALFGGSGHDDMDGGTARDRVSGGGGRDTLKGGGEEDLLYGQGGGDRILGQAGRDTLFGGRGNDILSGGGGVDEFAFYRRDGHDTITDFDAAREHILIYNGASRFGQLDIQQIGNNVEIGFANTTITVLDAEVSDFTGDVFDFV